MAPEPAPGPEAGPTLCCDDVWRAIEGASFAVLAHTNAAGDPRSSGIVYAVVDRHLYVAVAPDGWKARQIANGDAVSVTVTVRRGGLLSLLFPIPPATISFHARAVVHPAGSMEARDLPKQLQALVPAERATAAMLLELVPEGRFLTYGIGVSLSAMRDPVASRALVPVA
ncbi:MAG TPA: pyridoxamine 5'-phosphate oxidase family protein [Candidatus Limnocylindrales bacterium]|jgi:hypothetical protein